MLFMTRETLNEDTSLNVTGYLNGKIHIRFNGTWYTHNQLDYVDDELVGEYSFYKVDEVKANDFPSLKLADFAIVEVLRRSL